MLYLLIRSLTAAPCKYLLYDVKYYDYQVFTVFFFHYYFIVLFPKYFPKMFHKDVFFPKI